MTGCGVVRVAGLCILCNLSPRKRIYVTGLQKVLCVWGVYIIKAEETSWV